MIEAYLTIAGVVILIGFILSFFEGGGISSEGKEELEKFQREQEKWERKKHKYTKATMDTADSCYKCGGQRWESQHL